MNTPHTMQARKPHRKAGRWLAGAAGLLLLGLVTASYLSPDMQAVFAAAWAACI